MYPTALKLGSSVPRLSDWRPLNSGLQAIAGLIRAIRHRRELMRLAECEDYILADVGLSRDDVQAALSAPFWRDPTRHLAYPAHARSTATC